MACRRDEDGFSSTLREFAARIVDALQNCAWTSLQIEPLAQVAGYGMTLAHDPVVQSWLQVDADNDVSRVSPREPLASEQVSFETLRVSPFLAFKTVVEEQEDVARVALTWAAWAIGEELAFFRLPLTTRSTQSLDALACDLTIDLANRLRTLQTEVLRIRAAVIVRRFSNARAGLRYLFRGLRARGEVALESVSMPDFLAFTSVAPVNRLVKVKAMFDDLATRDLLCAALGRPFELVTTDDDLDAELTVKACYAERLLCEIKATAPAERLRHGWRYAEATDLGHYSSNSDYVELQRSRAAIYDALTRSLYDDVDRREIDRVAGRVGLVVSSLASSAETQAIVAHYEALRRAGWAPVIVLWPHQRGQSYPSARETSSFTVLDLVDLEFSDRVKVVRACCFDGLVFMNNLSWGWSEYIAASAMRLARNQVASYLSVITVGFKNLDYYLVGRESEGERTDSRYLEQLCIIDGSVLCFPSQQRGTPSHVRDTSRRLVVTCGATLPKLTPGALRLVFSVAHKISAERVVFYPFNPAWGLNSDREVVLTHISRVAAEVGFELNAIDLEGPWEDRNAIWSLLDRSDLYVDAFPHTGGLSVLDAVEAELPIIYQRGDQQRSLQAENIVSVTGAVGLAIDSAGVDQAALTELISRDRQPTRERNPANDLDDFSRRLTRGLQSIGIEVPADKASWLGSLEVEGALTLELGARRKVVSLTTRSDCEIAWISRSPPHDDAGLDSTVLSPSIRAVCKTYSETRSSVVLSVISRRHPAGARLCLSANGGAVGCSSALGAVQETDRTIAFIAPLEEGWNLLEFELEDSSDPTMRAVLSELRILGRSYL